MSKCRKMAERFIGAGHVDFQMLYDLYKAGWNARGKVDAEICHQSKEFELAESIEKENENGNAE